LISNPQIPRHPSTRKIVENLRRSSIQICRGLLASAPQRRFIISKVADPDIFPSRRRKIYSCLNFFCSYNFHNIEKILSFEQYRKNFFCQVYKEIKYFQTNKFFLLTQKYELGIRDLEETCPGSGSTSKKGTRSLIRNTDHIVYRT
jgi:hypothetical protein